MAGGATTLSIVTLAIMAVLLCRVSVMLSVTYKNFMLSVIMVSVIMLSVIMLSVAIKSFLLSVIMLSVILLIVIMLSATMLSVIAPLARVNKNMKQVFTQKMRWGD
jgi:ABC-type polysaccharide/polyol phosphate export permease